jgi:hypothetical protein
MAKPMTKLLNADPRILDQIRDIDAQMTSLRIQRRNLVAEARKSLTVQTTIERKQRKFARLVEELKSKGITVEDIKGMLGL